jgi:hypothetical protein
MTRRFVHDIDRVCLSCGGRGFISGEPCGCQGQNEREHHVGELPHAPAYARMFASACVAVAAAEREAGALEHALAETSAGPPMTIVWRFDLDDRGCVAPPPSVFDKANMQRGRLANTVLWPIERLWEAPGHPVYRAAVAILDAGFSVAHVTENEIHLGFHGESSAISER